jgi:hypothetical protein
MITRQSTVATACWKGQWMFRLCAFVIALPLVGWGLVGASAHAATFDPAPPTFSITSPTFSGVVEGPVNANVVVSAPGGSTWTPGATITLSAIADASGVACDTGTTPINPTAPITVGGDGSFSATFAWPSNLGEVNNTSTAYDLCASESNGGAQVGMATNKFIVLTNAAPQVTVEQTTAQEKQTITVTGQNWLPISQLSFALNGVAADPARAISLQTMPQTVYPDSTGNFTAQVILPGNITGSPANNDALVIIVGMGTQVGTTYPVQATSQQLTITAASTATPTPRPTATATTTPVGSSTAPANTGSGTDKLLIGLLGLIAVVLLLAGIIVAVLALRGRAGRDAPPAMPQRSPSGGFNPYGGNNFGQSTFDETVAGGPDWRYQQQQSPLWRDDDDDRWQPPGRPWSGSRVASPYDDRSAPPSPSARRYDDDDDDRYRTRMGDPYQPPAPPRTAGPPPISRPMGPPPSRPMGGPPPSRPTPPRSFPRQEPPAWDDDASAQDTGPAWPPQLPPQR